MRAGVWFAAALAASLAFVGLAPARATTITVDGSYTVSYTPIAGNSPTISRHLEATPISSKPSSSTARRQQRP